MLSDPGATLPRMTADNDDDIDVALDDPVVSVFTLDLAYLYQQRLEAMAAAGEPLPEGITVESLAEWRADHPDYDPAKPLGGQPIPAGVNVVPKVEDPALEADMRRIAADVLGQSLTSPDDPWRSANPPIPWQPPAEIAEIAEIAEVAEPDARCLARTASPIDQARRCTVHPDGAHQCYEGPGHQGAKRSGMIGGLVPQVRPEDPSRAPDWATHVCDCGFAWADVVQDRRPARDGRPTAAQRFAGQLDPWRWDRRNVADEQREIGL